MAVSYQIWIRDTTGAKIAVLADGKDSIWRSLSFVHTENAPGLAQLYLDGGSSLAGEIGENYQIEVKRRNLAIGLDWYTEWEGFVKTIRPETLDNGDDVMAIYAIGYLVQVRDRAIWYHAGTVYAQKSGSGETVVKEYVSENAGSGATSPPRLHESGVTQGLTVQADAGNGSTWTGSRSYRNLLEVIQEIAAATGIAFDIVGTGAGTFEFRVYPGQRGQDRSAIGLDTSTGLNGAGNPPVRFALGLGNMARPSLSVSYTDEINAVLTMGTGEESSRTTLAVSDPVATARTPWSRREATRNATQEGTDVSGLTSVAEEVLVSSVPQELFNFEIIQLPNHAYGKHYWFGDLITASYKSRTYHKKIIQVRINVSSQEGGERIEFDFGDVVPLDLSNPDKRMAYRISELGKRIDLIESRDPVAGGTGPGGCECYSVVQVRAASTGNVASLSGPQTIDGVSLIAGDRVLLKNQSTGSQNGVWVVAAGAWSRPVDDLTGGMLFLISEGTTNADSIWMLTTNDPITAGVTSLSFSNDLFPGYLTQVEGDLLYAALGHSHSSGDITDFSEAVDDRVAALLVAGTNITLTYNDPAGTLTVDAAGGGASALDDLSDVAITAPAQGDILTRNGTEFVNQNIGTNEVVARLPGGDVDGISMPASTFLARLAVGNIVAATVAEIKTLLNYVFTEIGGTLGIGQGGTGQTTQTAAFDALSPTTTKGDLIVSNGSDNVRLPVGSDGEVLTANSAIAEGVEWAAAPGGSGSRMETTEIDFGATPVLTKQFTITDVLVSATDLITAHIILKAPTGKDEDEMLMDELFMVCKAGTGDFTLHARGREGMVHGAFSIAYIVG